MQLSPRGESEDDEESEVEVLFEVKALYDYAPDAAAMSKSQKLPFRGSSPSRALFLPTPFLISILACHLH